MNEFNQSLILMDLEYMNLFHDSLGYSLSTFLIFLINFFLLLLFFTYRNFL